MVAMIESVRGDDATYWTADLVADGKIVDRTTSRQLLVEHRAEIELAAAVQGLLGGHRVIWITL